MPEPDFTYALLAGPSSMSCDGHCRKAHCLPGWGIGVVVGVELTGHPGEINLWPQDSRTLGKSVSLPVPFLTVHWVCWETPFRVFVDELRSLQCWVNTGANSLVTETACMCRCSLTSLWPRDPPCLNTKETLLSKRRTNSVQRLFSCSADICCCGHLFLVRFPSLAVCCNFPLSSFCPICELVLSLLPYSLDSSSFQCLCYPRHHPLHSLEGWLCTLTRAPRWHGLEGPVPHPLCASFPHQGCSCPSARPTSHTSSHVFWFLHVSPYSRSSQAFVGHAPLKPEVVTEPFHWKVGVTPTHSFTHCISWFVGSWKLFCRLSRGVSTRSEPCTLRNLAPSHELILKGRESCEGFGGKSPTVS